MSDLIDRQAAIDAIMAKPALHGSDGSWYHGSDIKQALQDLPSAQPEETCDTCTHWRFKNTRYEDWRCECCRMSYHPNYYERRTDGSD